MLNRNLKILLAVIFLFGTAINAQKILQLKTKDFKAAIDDKGIVKSFMDIKNNEEYLRTSTKSPLLQIRYGGVYEAPSTADFMPAQKIIKLHFKKSGITVEVKYEEKPTHLVLEVSDIAPAGKPGQILWGPYSTRINKIIGEIIGVVRNDKYAIGIQALNVKTSGGYPDRDEGFEFGRGQAAMPDKDGAGSLLQAYSIDRSKERVISVWNGQWPDMPVEPVKEESLIGSKIALFGCDVKKALERIGEIEVAENLPHPMINGVWAKISPETGRSYLIAEYSETTIDELLAFTKKADLMTLYHMELWESWGHFELNKKDFPNGLEGFKKCLAKADALGIRLGAHTLTNFITTNDPYVTPVPDKRLVKTGSSILKADINETTKEIQVESAKYFKNENANWLHTVIIDEELVRYRTVTDTEPYKLLDCERGAFGTKAASHKAASQVGKLADHPYKVFFPNVEMQREMAAGLAKRFNQTGLSQMDFDGHEGCGATGQGDYAIDLFAEDFYRNLDHTVINGTSNSKHFYWHINTYCNWGEPWYEGFRESMQQYRINNQALLERNFLPNMLGWYLLNETTSLSDIEWMLARAAGYNAGFALATSYNALKKNPETDKILEAIKNWETARRNKAFSDKLRGEMKDPAKEFHLENAGGSKWKLYPFHASEEFMHENAAKQPGEPAGTEWSVINNDEAQPLQFKIKAAGDKGALKNPVFEIDNFTVITFDAELKANETLLCEGGRMAKIYNDKGRFVKTVQCSKEIPVLQKGKHKIIFNCTFSEDSSLKIKAVFKTIGNPVQIGK